MQDDPTRYATLTVACATDEVDVLLGRLTLLGADGIEQRDGATLTRGGPAAVACDIDESIASARENAAPLELQARLDARVGGFEVVPAALEGASTTLTGDRARITLLQGVPKGDKLETVARQATELGVERVVLVWTERSVPRERADRAAARHERLLRVIEGAARQCHRAALPALLPACDLPTALALAGDCALRLVAWEEASRPLATLDHPGGGVALLVGPEGGSTPARRRPPNPRASRPCPSDPGSSAPRRSPPPCSR